MRTPALPTRLLLAALTCLLLATACGRRDAPPPSPASAAWPPFDAAAAWDDLENLVALGPRPNGSPGHRHAIRYLTSRLRSSGLEPEISTFTNRYGSGDVVFHTISATLTSRTDRILLLTTHYDSRATTDPEAVYANSASSGAAVLLEIARVLAAAHDPNGPEVRFVFFDGMEPIVRHGIADGLQGSKHLARTLDAEGKLRRVAALINLDLVGDRDLTFTLPKNVSTSLRKQLLDAARSENVRERFKLVPVEIGDDHDPFHERGVPAITLIDFEYGSAPGRNDYWRTPQDTLDKLDRASLDITGRVTLRLVRALVSPDFPGETP